MGNLFKNAYFGKLYETKNHKKAIYLFSVGCGVYCVTESSPNRLRYYQFGGIPYEFCDSRYDGENIIGEWKG